MSKDQRWYVYIVETKQGPLYTGITVDVERRFNEHLSSPKGAKYFRGRTPKAIVYIEECDNRSQASKRECEIKALTRKQKEKLIKNYKSNSGSISPS